MSRKPHDRRSDHFEPYEEERGIPAPFYLGAFGLLLWGLSVFISDRQTLPALAPGAVPPAASVALPPPPPVPQTLPDTAIAPATWGIITKGKAAAWACASCHGPSGQGTSAIPRLAGLSAAYVTKQLDDFAAGARVNESMRLVAAALTPAERIDLGHAYAAMAVPPSTHVALGGDVKRGETLATAGDDTRNISACFSCHGEKGLGVAPDFPALAGQPAAYIDQQLLLWTTGLRHNSPDTMMNDIAKTLSPDDRWAVADYLSGLPPPDPRTAAN